jgi:glycosyltransferase involved in cell wall biosynthesis
MRIDQVLVSASAGDAVTNFARTLRALLRPQVKSDIYALYVDEQLDGDILPLREYGTGQRANHQRDLLVFHLSIGEAEVTTFVRERPERLAIVYHNISPAAPFRPYDPGFADLLDQGRHELNRLRDRAPVVYTVSEYNASELRAIGYRAPQVLPLIVDTGALTLTVPDATITAEMDKSGSGPVILAVGQLLPHKRIDFLVDAFYILSTYLIPEAQLLLVGPHRLEPYHSAIQRQIDELHLERVWVTGAVPTNALATLFRKADVFATASEHEGFCVPLLEAMAFDLPFLARRFTAVPETVGSAGLVVEPDDGPATAAEALATLINDATLRQELVARGRRRLADFDVNLAKQAWQEALLGAA